MKITVLIHAKNVPLLEDYFGRLSEKEDFGILKEQEILTVYVNSDIIEFLEIENLEQYTSTRLSANIVFYPESESDRVFILVSHGFYVRNLNTVIPQLPYLGYDEVHFVKVMKDKLKFG